MYFPVEATVLVPVLALAGLALRARPAALVAALALIAAGASRVYLLAATRTRSNV